MRDVVVYGINLSKRIALTMDGQFGDIRCFLDLDGDETQDAEIAEIAIVEWRSGGWSSLCIDEFTEDAYLE